VRCGTCATLCPEVLSRGFRAAGGVNSPSRRRDVETESFGVKGGNLSGQKGVGEAACTRSRAGREEAEIGDGRSRNLRESAGKRATPRGLALGVACQLVGWKIRCRSSGYPSRTLFEMSLEIHTPKNLRCARRLLSCCVCDELVCVGVEASQQRLDLRSGVGNELVAMGSGYFL
jgi:hypothetical protein